MSRRALRARNVGQAHLRMCVYLFYLLSRCIRPEGPWQRFAAALSDSSCFSPPLHNLILAGCCGPEEAFHSEELQGAEGARAYTNFLPLLLHLLLSLPPLPSSSSSSLCYCPRVAAGGEPGWPWTTARRPHWGPRGGDPAREAAPEAGPGSPAPRPARPNPPLRRPLGVGRRPVGGRGWTGRGTLFWGEKVCRRSDTLCMCSGWTSM